MRLSLSAVSVGFVSGEQGRVHGLHAGGTGEGPHQPGVDAVHVVNVEAGQEPNGIAVLKIHHADHTPGGERKRERDGASINEHRPMEPYSVDPP